MQQSTMHEPPPLPEARGVLVGAQTEYARSFISHARFRSHFDRDADIFASAQDLICVSTNASIRARCFQYIPLSMDIFLCP